MPVLSGMHILPWFPYFWKIPNQCSDISAWPKREGRKAEIKSESNLLKSCGAWKLLGPDPGINFTAGTCLPSLQMKCKALITPQASRHLKANCRSNFFWWSHVPPSQISSCFLQMVSPFTYQNKKKCVKESFWVAFPFFMSRILLFLPLFSEEIRKVGPCSSTSFTNKAPRNST